MNGKVIHEQIIKNFVTMYERDLQAMNTFIFERYIDRSISIGDRLSSMVRRKLRDPYVSNDELAHTARRKIKNHTLVAKMIKTADNMTNYVMSLSYFRVSTCFHFYILLS